MRFNKRKEKTGASFRLRRFYFQAPAAFPDGSMFESGSRLSVRRPGLLPFCPFWSGRPGTRPRPFQVHQFLFQFVFHRRQFLFGLEPPGSSFLLDAQRFFER